MSTAAVPSYHCREEVLIRASEEAEDTQKKVTILTKRLILVMITVMIIITVIMTLMMNVMMTVVMTVRMTVIMTVMMTVIMTVMMTVIMTVMMTVMMTVTMIMTVIMMVIMNVIMTMMMVMTTRRKRDNTEPHHVYILFDARPNKACLVIITFYFFSSCSIPTISIRLMSCSVNIRS